MPSDTGRTGPLDHAKDHQRDTGPLVGIPRAEQQVPGQAAYRGIECLADPQQGDEPDVMQLLQYDDPSASGDHVEQPLGFFEQYDKQCFLGRAHTFGEVQPCLSLEELLNGSSPLFPCRRSKIKSSAKQAGSNVSRRIVRYGIEGFFVLLQLFQGAFDILDAGLPFRKIPVFPIDPNGLTADEQGDIDQKESQQPKDDPLIEQTDKPGNRVRQDNEPQVIEPLEPESVADRKPDNGVVAKGSVSIDGMVKMKDPDMSKA